MDNHQLRTFVVVAQEGSITRAADRLYLSQPAISAHIKALESSLDLTLFERTPQGMRLTLDGQRILLKAEETLQAHQDLVEEARKIKGQITGVLQVGATSHTDPKTLGKIMIYVAEHFPEVDVKLQHLSTQAIIAGIRSGDLDAGIYNEFGEAPDDFFSAELSKIRLLLASSPHFPQLHSPIDWQALQHIPWIYPGEDTCCGKAAEQLFERHGFRPKKLIHADREKVTRTLIAGGLGVGLVHDKPQSQSSEQTNDIVILDDISLRIRTLLVCKKSRQTDPVLHSLIDSMVDNLSSG
ncbi:LysR family transcriptional regulator [Vibrio penaeicida]|uniref:LysR family transcriptional regulator n=1 Tax=Vibrio penaeicida TaxID=104609 RepID=UPI000CE9B334|nr:LysR family transcriptional regulator [Vibrio penaeicida]